MTLAALASDFASLEASGVHGRAAGADIPPTFVEFCELLGVTLTLGQRVVALVAYDGVEPYELDDIAEREAARRIFGDVERIPPAARTVFVAICGARAGKSYVLVALRLLHLALTVDLFTLAPGEVASCPIFAPDTDLAEQDLRYVRGALEATGLRDLVQHDVSDRIALERFDGRRVEIVVRAASGRGRTGRGRTLVGAAMDEAAFFRDANYQVNDDEIYKALHPRILPGGQLIVATTPWAESGLAFELFERNQGHPVDALSAHAPTLLLRDVPLTRELVAREEAHDPDNAEREYGARFMGAGADVFFEPATIARCIDETLDAEIPRKPMVGEEVAAGGDLGFTSDSSALCIVHRDRGVNVVGEIAEWRPEKGAPLKPSATIQAMADRITWHGGTYLMADKHYRETAIEHLAAADLGFVDAPNLPAEAYIRTRAMMRDGRVKIPKHARFLAQLKEVRGRKETGGTLRILQPRKPRGGHGDLVSAFVLAVYQLGGDIIEPDAPTNEREVLLREAERDKERRRRDVESRSSRAAGGWASFRRHGSTR